MIGPGTVEIEALPLVAGSTSLGTEVGGLTTDDLVGACSELLTVFMKYPSSPSSGSEPGISMGLLSFSTAELPAEFMESMLSSVDGFPSLPDPDSEPRPFGKENMLPSRPFVCAPLRGDDPYLGHDPDVISTGQVASST